MSKQINSNVSTKVELFFPGTSHLSVGSHLSGRSTRSPSPHKMLLETSFCGSKPMNSQSVEPEVSPTLVKLVEKSVSNFIF